MAAMTSPQLILGGGSLGSAAGLNNPGVLELTYQNLLSGTTFFPASGAKILNLTASAIEACSPVQIGVSITAAEKAANLAILAKIAAYCRANGITVQVEAVLTYSPTWSTGPGAGYNELVDQWAPTAASVGLPITSIEDVQEIATAQSPSTFASYATIEANAVKTLIEDYASSSYKMTASNLAVGDMEGTANDQAWWNAYNAAAKADGVASFSFVTADPNWFGPWVGALSVAGWQGGLESLSTVAAANHMALEIDVQGPQTATSANQFVQQAEQNAADLAMLAATGSIVVSDVKFESWQPLPVGIGLVNSPDSVTNEAAEVGATYPLYAAGSITAQGSLSFQVPGQILLNTGTAQSIVPLSVHWDVADIAQNDRLAVVLIDQTGILTATKHGSGTVSNTASNILILNGNSADLAAELSSVTLNEPNAGPDTIDVETYDATGRISDNQISVFTAGTLQSVGSINSTSSLQGWLSSSAVLNNGTVIGGGSVLTSETLYWSTTGELPTGQTAFVKTIAIHEPLAEYGVELASPALLGTTTSKVVDVYDPKVDTGGRFANNPGVNKASFAPLPGWNGWAFDPASEVMPLIVVTTTNTFDPKSGQLEASVDSLAPNPLTIVDRTGTHPDTFATAFNSGGSQVTEYNTGNNAAWQTGWGNQFSSATLTYDAAGQLVEMFLQGGPKNPLFTIDDVFDPDSGQLWEEFQSTTPPPEAPGTTLYATTNLPYQAGFATGPRYVIEFNTGNNPNWDYVDWGSTIASDTEVWADYFIMENFAGFAVNFPSQYGGGLNAYPYTFVNGTALDLMYLPKTITVNLNALGTVIIDSQTLTSGLSGLNEIDAAGATGTVTITGLVAGGSTLIGGDNTSTITGYGHDTIIAGAGITTINTGSGGSTIMLASASASVAVAGNNNNITATTGDLVTLYGIGDTIHENGRGEVLNFLKGGTFFQDSATSSATVIGDAVTVWMNTTGGTVCAIGNNDVITGGTNAVINLTGDSGVIGTWQGANVSVSGHNEIVSGSTISVATVTAGTSVTVRGNNDTITAVAGSIITINGATDILNGSGVTVFLNSSTASVTMFGSNDVVNAIAGDNVVITGLGETVNGSNMTVAVGGNTPVNVTAATQTTDVRVHGNCDMITAVAGSTVTVDGAGDILNGSGVTVFLNTSTASVTIFGSNDVVNAIAGGNVVVTGLGETVNGSDMTVGVGSNTSVTVTGSNDTINLAGTGVTVAVPGKGVVAVTGNAVNVAGNFDVLEGLAANGKLKSITLTDGGMPNFTLSATQLSTDTHALADIGGKYNLGVTAVTAASATRVAALAHVAMVSVNDTTANITANLGALEVLAASGKLGSITLTDGGMPNLTLSATQLSTDAHALADIGGKYNLGVTAVTAASATSMAALAHVATVSVNDSAANITANLGVLEGLAASGKLGSITLTDGNTPNLTLSTTQLSTDAHALADISGKYNLGVTAVTAARATSVAVLAHVAMVSVNDTAANISASLGALEVLAASRKLGSITLTDGNTANLILSAAQLSTYAPALAAIGGKYNLGLTTVTAASATRIAALPHIAMVSVNDTAANITANLGALQVLSASGKLGSIDFIDRGMPTLTLSHGQLSTYASALAHISSPYILDPTAADAITWAGLPNVTSLAVIDTVANVAANFSALQTLGISGRLSTVTFMDNANFTITVPGTQLNTVTLANIKAVEASVQSQVIYLRDGLDLTLAVQSAAAMTIVGAANNDVINILSGNDSVYLGSAGETVNGGSGNDTFYVTAATIGATISGGGGQNVLRAWGGGKMTMGTNITGVSVVFLDNGSDGYNFVANTTPGLVIQSNSGAAVVVVGAASQTIFGPKTGRLTVQATAANAGARVVGGSNGATLEITTGGTVTLNANDQNLTVQLDATTHLGLGRLSFITAVGATSGHDTITAGGANQTLKSIGGNDTLIGSSSFGDTFVGTAAGLTGDIIKGFGGSDVIQITDVTYSTLKALSFNSTSGNLTVTDATHGVTLSMGGGYTSTNFTATSGHGGGTIISFVGH